MEGHHRRARIAEWGINVALRLAMVGFAVEAVTAVNDPRFTGNGIPVRDLLFVGVGLSLTIPLAWAVLRRPRVDYPLRAESLLLSILVVDMAANSLDLYNQPWRLDLVPHAYGPLAAVLALRMLGVAVIRSMVVVNLGHLLLEVQEALGDTWFGTHNVRGWPDTIGDLSAGLIASVLIPCLWLWVRHLGSTWAAAAPGRDLRVSRRQTLDRSYSKP